jgi:hypothetical protein
MHIPQKFISLILILGFSLFTLCNAPAQTSSSTAWLILGPIPVVEGGTDQVSEGQQQQAFKTDYLNPAAMIQVEEGQTQIIHDKTYQWQVVHPEDQTVNLDQLFDSADYVSAYAFTTIDTPEEQKALLGVGSDDGVRIWLNGELVHDNWVPRGLLLDDDVVPVTLKKGSNHLLLKVQDIQQGWGFSARILPPEIYTEKLTEAAASGQMDEVELLLSHGADINAKNALGLTALHVAKMHGRQEIADKLVQQGANPDIAMPAKGEMADVLFEKAIGEHDPGASVLVAKDGQILYEKGFGFANLKKDIPITPETEFRIGSITKQFTASAILKLQEEGKISVDDKLSKFIPDFPRGNEVTIHHLLTHTSGIKSYTDKINFEDKEVTKPIESE